MYSIPLSMDTNRPLVFKFFDDPHHLEGVCEESTNPYTSTDHDTFASWFKDKETLFAVL